MITVLMSVNKMTSREIYVHAGRSNRGRFIEVGFIFTKGIADSKVLTAFVYL